MTQERVINQEEYFTTCVRVGCSKPATNHPLRCDTHVYYLVPCACPIDHDGGGCSFAFYNKMEYTKAERLAREAGIEPIFKDADGRDAPSILPYKTCHECGHWCRYSRLGTKQAQLEGWPDEGS